MSSQKTATDSIVNKSAFVRPRKQILTEKSVHHSENKWPLRPSVILTCINNYNKLHSF